MRIKNDPFQRLVKIVRKRYPKLRANIWFAEKKDVEPALGYTFFPDNRSTPDIYIRVDIPFVGAVDVLAHELAHIIVGTGPKAHGKEFKKAFRWIRSEFVKWAE